METLTTSVEEKLPPAVRALLDEAVPLPADVLFFEQSFTAGALAKRLLLGLAFLAAGAVIVPLSLYFIFAPDHHAAVYDTHQLDWWLAGFGGVLLLAAWMLISSVPACWALRRRQAAGERTRYGVFLLMDVLVSRSFFDTTVIPRERFSGLVAGAVRYSAGAQQKSFTLPSEWIGTTAANVSAAIVSWENKG